MKLIALFFSLFSSLINYNGVKEHEITCINQEMAEVVDNFQKPDNYEVTFNHESGYVKYKDKKIFSFDYYSLKYYLINNNLYLFYKESFSSSLKMMMFKDGKISIDNDLNNPLYSEFDINYFHNAFYIASSIKEYTNEKIVKEYSTLLKGINAILLKVNINLELVDVKIHGGELNDYFDSIVSNGDKLYVTGFKDTLSGGTFGNGGGIEKGYFLAVISLSLQVEKYVIFDSFIKSFDIIDKNIYIFLNEYIHLLDSDLSVKSSLKIASGCVFGKIMNNFIPVVITEKEINMYDYNEKRLLSTYNFTFQENFIDSFIIDDSLYFKTQYGYMRLLIFDQGIKNNIYIYDENEKNIENFTIHGLFKDYIGKGMMDSDFNPSVFGTYEIIVNYGEFDIPIKIKVLERHNVTNGKVYPTGYNLLFSGKGYLNGNPIINNHQIDDDGAYTLTLVGKDETIDINFFVKTMDIIFTEESIKNWDYDIFPGEERKLTLDVNISDEFALNDIIINDSSYPFELVDNKIIIKFKEYSKGLHKYVFNSFVFEDKETKEEYIKPMNKTLTLKVLSERISLENTITERDNTIEYLIKINNNKENIRYLKFMADKNNEEVNYVTLENQKIVLNFQSDGTIKKETIICYLVYDVGKEYYEEEQLFTFEYELNKTNELGTLELSVIENKIDELKINLKNNKYLKTLTIDNKDVYKYQEKNNLKSIIYGLIVLTIFSMIFIINLKLKRKRK